VFSWLPPREPLPVRRPRLLAPQFPRPYQPSIALPHGGRVLLSSCGPRHIAGLYRGGVMAIGRG